MERLDSAWAAFARTPAPPATRLCMAGIGPPNRVYRLAEPHLRMKHDVYMDLPLIISCPSERVSDAT
ncbi:hypothetical protein BBBOND_0313080 [Babesia bigemina]|uniref:Uncharacterized protein n=1 Tax=Babesia bigemina TaxID=5866 RepID=A0A061DEJ8_BABBI|nr:hypothetical protein BBBOND_0313080 [Babesia bigemina]CDR97405.1 hypothetical protein BBBOND_0313080 [Babesia bigemina]|eukprot:XP_012769591.1 hypothetical protein BBBOND_0313080 [Babesia bigemina]